MVLEPGQGDTVTNCETVAGGCFVIYPESRLMLQLLISMIHMIIVPGRESANLGRHMRPQFVAQASGAFCL